MYYLRSFKVPLRHFESALLCIRSRGACSAPIRQYVRPVNAILVLQATTSRWTTRSFHTGSVVADDTIYALSTAPGRAAIAVIRVSGAACLQIYKNLCPGRPLPKPRTATLRQLRSPGDPSKVLDIGALLLYLPSPNTATGEDILELHVHGGPAIVRSVLEAIPQAAGSRDDLANVRPAGAGEFTKRAFYNGRIDLTEVEALGEALAAETEQQRRLAVSGASSGLTQRYEEWRSMLLYARGELEALIDFSEDQHFDESPTEFMASVSKQVIDLKRQMELHILNSERGELLRSGINVALLGAPNAGKSSLLNRIVGREAAIVSAEEGTTRDIVDVSIDMQGWLVRLGDMAGVRTGLRAVNDQASAQSTAGSGSHPVGAIEQEGIRRARERALQSDLVIVLISLRPTPEGKIELAINDELLDAVRECRAAKKHLLFAVNKLDLLHEQTSLRRVTLSRLLTALLETFPGISTNDVFCLSCKEADTPNHDQPDAGGLQTFFAGLTKKFSSMTSAAVGLGKNESMSSVEAQTYWTTSLSVTHRQSQSLQECVLHLQNFLEINSPCSHTQDIQELEDEHLPTETVKPNAPIYGYFDTIEAPPTKSTTADRRYHIDNHGDFVGEIEKQQQLASTLRGSSRPSEETEIDIVTAAEHLRHAADCLAKLTSRGDGVSSGADVEDVLGVVFEKFCVGK